MKNIKLIRQLLLFLSICMVYLALAQVCPDTSEIRTDFNDAVNTQFNRAYPGLTNPFINKYNWAGYKPNSILDGLYLNPNAGWDPLLTGITGGTWKMTSPFSEGMGSDYNYLYQMDGIIPSRDDLPNLDWPWERGWELMWMQTGYFPDMREINNTDNKSFLPGTFGLVNNKLPYIILYNRYTGKMRLFANLITEFGKVDQIVTYLEYDLRKNRDVSGIFRNVANYDRPLDMPTANYGATVYNKNSNNNNSWYSNDIQLGFDPCVCEYQSSMDFTLKTMKELKLNLYGRYLQLTVPVNQIEEDFLTQSSIQQYGQQKGNSLIYKKTQLMYEDYIRQLEDYNNRLKDYNSIENALKRQVLGWGRDLVISAVGLALPQPTLRNFIVANAITLKGKPFPDTTTADGWAKAAREASKGLMGKGFDYFTQDFVIDKPTAPVMPTATLGEMRITGDIFDDNEVQIGSLRTPGTVKPGDQFTIHSYPIYNKPTGLFALLERPKMSVYNQVEYKDIVYMIDPDGGNLNNRLTMKRTHSLKLKFDETLKYKYNDAVHIDKQKTSTYVAFIVEYIHDYDIKNMNDIPSACYQPFTMGMGLESGVFNPLHHYINGAAVTRVFETVWIPMSELNKQKIHLVFTDSMDAPFNTLSNCHFHNIAHSLTHKIKNIKMKIMTDIYFLDNPEINTSQVFTYMIFDSEAPANETSVLRHAESLYDYDRYHQGEIGLYKEHITPTHQSVTTVKGNELYIDAERVNIGGGISVAPGYKLFIRSLNDVVLNPEIVIAPEISIETVSSFDILPDFKEPTNAELIDYCRGQNKRYNANTSLGKSALNFEDIADEIKDKPETQTRMVFYPNPANTELVIQVSDESDYSYQLFDITSRPVLQGEIEGGKAGIVNIAQAQEGIYILRVVGKGQTFTQKIIIKH